MKRAVYISFLFLFPLFLYSFSGAPAAASAPGLDHYLTSGRFPDAVQALKQDRSATARFELAVVTLLTTFNSLVDDIYRYSPTDFSRFLPVLRLPVGKNPDPLPIDYNKARQVFLKIYNGLKEADTCLREAEAGDVASVLHVGLFPLTDPESGSVSPFYTLFGHLMNIDISREDADRFELRFDNGDVHWLRSYCNILMAFTSLVLAYDWSELFNRTGHLLFSRPESPFSYIFGSPHLYRMQGFDVADLIAFIHLVNFPVAEKDRLTSLLNHLETAIAQNRLCWKDIMAETDNDREWLPNPNQKGIGIRVNQEMVDSWGRLLDETEMILSGKKLIPFWKTNPNDSAGRNGINLRRVFTEPSRLDLVLWVHGSAAVPYLEKGEVTSQETWNEIIRVFGSDFMGYAIYFN